MSGVFGGEMNKEEIFYWLCFCICSSQTTYKSNKIVNERLRIFQFYDKDISKSELKDMLKPVRFYNNKTEWLLKAKKKFKTVLATINSPLNSYEKREYLTNNIFGLGMKTASLFLKELGCTDLAVIDVHILKFLKSPLPKKRKEYLRLEQAFCNVAKQEGMTPAELDTKLWKRYSGN